jgi:hypothetical protein
MENINLIMNHENIKDKYDELILEALEIEKNNIEELNMDNNQKNLVIEVLETNTKNLKEYLSDHECNREIICENYKCQNYFYSKSVHYLECDGKCEKIDCPTYELNKN